MSGESTRILIPGRSGMHEKDATQPFWASVARMRPGSYVRVGGAGAITELFEVLEGPRYGRPEVNDVSIVVRSLATGRRSTQAAWAMAPCAGPCLAARGLPVAAE